MEYNGFEFNDGYLQMHPDIRKALETGEIEGIPFRVVGWGPDIETGDTYIAERGSGMKMLTCKKNDLENGWVLPMEIAYPFDTGECIKIELDI